MDTKILHTKQIQPYTMCTVLPIKHLKRKHFWWTDSTRGYLSPAQPVAMKIRILLLLNFYANSDWFFK